jgi:acyl-CoA thioesterase FadM
VHAKPRLLNQADVKLVYVDLAKMKPVAIPAHFRTLFIDEQKKYAPSSAI